MKDTYTVGSESEINYPKHTSVDYMLRVFEKIDQIKENFYLLTCVGSTRTEWERGEHSTIWATSTMLKVSSVPVPYRTNFVSVNDFMIFIIKCKSCMVIG